MCWNGDSYGCPYIQFTFNLDITIQQFQVFQHDVQSQSCSLYVEGVFRSEKPLKQMLLIVLRYTNSLVCNDELKGLPLFNEFELNRPVFW